MLIAGYYEAGIDFDLGPIQGPADELSGFLVKLDASGKPIWQKSFSPFGDNLAHAGAGGVAVRPSGEVVLSGWFGGPIDIGTGTLQTPPHTVSMFVATFAGDGEPIWARAFGGSGETSPQALAIDAAGDLVAAGRTTGTISIDGLTVSEFPFHGVLVVKLDEKGKGLFAVGLDGDHPTGFAVDADRNVFVSSAGVTKLDPQGKVLWNRGSQGAILSNRAALGLDASGNALLTGTFENGFDFGVIALDTGDVTTRTAVVNIGR
ncbi:MAG: hypothetical protein QM820_65370 [Minicystis sp.]